MYGYDIRSNTAVLFYVSSFKPVRIYDVKNFKDYWHMHSQVTNDCAKLNELKTVLPVLG